MSGYTANREKPSSLHASFLSCASQICTSTGKTESNHVSDEQEMLPPLRAIALLTGFRSAKMCTKNACVHTYTPAQHILKHPACFSRTIRALGPEVGMA